MVQKERTPVAERTPEERVRTFEEVVRGYTEEQAIKEASRCIGCKHMPCSEACPIHTNTREYITLISQGDFKGALQSILKDNPLPSICGRVCTHPCEYNCTLRKLGDPVAIALLKRAASDFADVRLQPGEEKGKNVAIVGSGPAGLAAATELRRQGYGVTIFEKDPLPGGMLAVGIPEYRLPKEIMMRDINRILDMGVDLKPGVRVDCEMLDKLLKDYDAALLGIGAHQPKWMKIEGEDLKGVYHAIPFLRDVEYGKKIELGKRVAVIGGGNAAMDAVRTARRMGSGAFIVYRRTRKEMPADPAEVKEAEEEGIRFNFLVNPVRIVGDEECRVRALECVRMKLGEPDESGRARPVPVEGSNFMLEVDNVIEAISQAPDLSPFLKKKFETTRWNTLKVNEGNMTSVEGVFAAGDVVLGPMTVVHAIADAKRAVKGIMEYIG